MRVQWNNKEEGKSDPIEFYTYFSLYFLTKIMMKKGNKRTILLQDVSNRRMGKRKG